MGCTYLFGSGFGLFSNLDLLYYAIFQQTINPKPSKMKQTLFAFALLAGLASCGDTSTDQAQEMSNETQEQAAPAVQEEINQIDNSVKEMEEASSQLDNALEGL